ncbi:hypothetical protein P171DRAFT_435415 [Karstenula rhodostoma CBS 690.94]|uniref:Uncharacterized protein n=1 Tax=Karstenula rhodostoma CBS 690.94 TaxID=1392251 RepID=A0A9P4U925_9PLEO|nr:hypothetical protein P171DRAFT_435415 [Karstenula rhodostoma CBS 690.94]
MANFVRMSRNYVNLETLYEIPVQQSWSGFLFMGHGVNLGRLYADTPSWESRTGWGYFEDGSVYLNAKPWGNDMNHASFEAKMKLLEPFVRQLPPQLEQPKSKHSNLSRLLLVDCQPSIKLSESEESCTIFARNAIDGERLTIEWRPFRQCHLTYDRAIPSQPSSRLDQPPVVLHRLMRVLMNKALQNFRGTLVDGVLQPNVWLGNGLNLSDSNVLDRERTITGLQKFLKLGDTRRQSLTWREATISNREAAISRREAAVNAREAAVNTREAAINTREAAINTREAAINTREAAINTREAAVKERETILDEREAALHAAPWYRKVAALNKHEARLHDAIGLETSNQLAELREQLLTQPSPELDSSSTQSVPTSEIQSASQYDDIFPELADFDTPEYRTRITLPRRPAQ